MTLIIGIIAFILAITIHEAAHAWMADKLGDPTARLMGRLSLNPIVHYAYGTGFYAGSIKITCYTLWLGETCYI